MIKESLRKKPALTSPRHLVFIDQQVPDYQVLLAGVIPDSEVYLLDSGADTVAQMTAIIHQKAADSIHLVAHGYPGGIKLGNSHLDLENLEQYEAEIKGWLCEHLVIYACQVGAKPEFLERLHQLTGATVRASEEEVGPQWHLGVVRGVGETPLAFTEAVREAYQGVLATFTVSNTEDGGEGSLRQAIADANEAAGADEITFDPGLAGAVIALSSGELLISDEVIITGLGADNLTIDAQGNSGVFRVNDGDYEPDIEVAISGLTITGGGSYNDGVGNLENLTISNTIISGNSDGGIAHYDGDLKINNSTISNNRGGGINNTGNLTISNSTISSNSESNLGGGITNSGYGNLTVSNSTISNNTANYNGGAIFSLNGNLTISNTTITLNQSLQASGIAGIANYTSDYSTSTVTLSNTIVSGNLGKDVELFNYDNDISNNNITSSGGNLIGTGNALAAFDQPGDTIGVTRPGLEPLADNGGPTLTHALEADSPAVNNGIDSLIPPGITTDQRGEARVVGPQVDIGAFESEFTEFPLPTVALLVQSPLAVVGGIEGSYRLSRTGRTDTPLTVALRVAPSSGLTAADFTLSGVEGSFPDYTATIPAGESFIDLVVTASEDTTPEFSESLVLDLVPSSDYRLGSDGGVVTIVPETLIVTNSNDSGEGSLRAAITLANQIAGNNNRVVA